MRRHLFYSGRVQGVGFRYTAQRLAQQFAVTGWVRNLPDGRVEMMVEGTSEKGEAFLNRLADSMSDHIQSIEQYNEMETGEFGSFEIIH